MLGDAGSALSDSFQDGLLDAPSYTRPASFRGMEVPAVLRSGDHGAILDWREAQRLERTRRAAPTCLDDAGSARLADAPGAKSPALATSGAEAGEESL